MWKYGEQIGADTFQHVCCTMVEEKLGVSISKDVASTCPRTTSIEIRVPIVLIRQKQSRRVVCGN